MVSSAFKLFDVRLVSITEKLNNVSERQKSMEESMKLLHETEGKSLCQLLDHCHQHLHHQPPSAIKYRL